MFCIRCGTENPGHAKFCFKCGSSLISDSAQQMDRKTEADATPLAVPGTVLVSEDAAHTTEPKSAQQIVRTAEERYKGVRGWLLLFCVILLVFIPLGGVLNFVAGYRLSSIFFTDYPGLLYAAIIDGLLTLALVSFSMYAGIALWTLRPNAPKIAQSFLMAALGYQVVAFFLPLLTGLPNDLVGEAMQEGGLNVFKTMVSITIWSAYLHKSKRVRATYQATASSSEISL